MMCLLSCAVLWEIPQYFLNPSYSPDNHTVFDNRFVYLGNIYIYIYENSETQACWTSCENQEV